MARHIKETPELYGIDARRFSNASRMKTDKALRDAERARIKESVASLIAFACNR